MHLFITSKQHCLSWCYPLSPGSCPSTLTNPQYVQFVSLHPYGHLHCCPSPVQALYFPISNHRSVFGHDDEVGQTLGFPQGFANCCDIAMAGPHITTWIVDCWVVLGFFNILSFYRSQEPTCCPTPYHEDQGCFSHLSNKSQPSWKPILNPLTHTGNSTLVLSYVWFPVVDLNHESRGACFACPALGYLLSFRLLFLPKLRRVSLRSATGCRRYPITHPKEGI